MTRAFKSWQQLRNPEQASAGRSVERRKLVNRPVNRPVAGRSVERRKLVNRPLFGDSSLSSRRARGYAVPNWWHHIFNTFIHVGPKLLKPPASRDDISVEYGDYCAIEQVNCDTQEHTEESIVDNSPTAPPPPMPSGSYKTQICKFGDRCPYGKRCRFAHSQEELEDCRHARVEAMKILARCRNRKKLEAGLDAVSEQGVQTLLDVQDRGVQTEKRGKSKSYM